MPDWRLTVTALLPGIAKGQNGDSHTTVVGAVTTIRGVEATLCVPAEKTHW
jgi:hypothetical protein